MPLTSTTSTTTASTAPGVPAVAMESFVGPLPAGSPTGPSPRNDLVDAARYVAPGWITRRVMNPIVTRLVTFGFSVWGARELHVRGRTSGEWRAVPVNLLEVDDRTYLVAPRGVTQWVRNLRVAGCGRLRSGRRHDEFTAVEVDIEDRAPVLRAYLERWAFEVGTFFEGLDAGSTDAELTAVAAGFPVFRVEFTAG